MSTATKNKRQTETALYTRSIKNAILMDISNKDLFDLVNDTFQDPLIQDIRAHHERAEKFLSDCEAIINTLDIIEGE